MQVVNKTIAQYLKTQVDTNTLNWELYLAPMAFAYNTSFHRTIGSTTFKATYGIEARTPDFDSRTLYGEDLPTDFYQRQQVCHHIAKQTAFNNTEKNIEKYTEGHKKRKNPEHSQKGKKYC